MARPKDLYGFEDTDLLEGGYDGEDMLDEDTLDPAGEDVSPEEPASSPFAVDRVPGGDLLDQSSDTGGSRVADAIRAAQKALKEDRTGAPSLGGSIAKGFSGRKTEPGFGGTLSMLSAGLADYRQNKATFDATRRDRDLEMTLKGAEAEDDMTYKRQQLAQKYAANADTKEYRMAVLMAKMGADMGADGKPVTYTDEKGITYLKTKDGWRVVPATANAAPAQKAGEKAVDQVIGKDYADWITQGRNNATTQISLLSNATQRLRTEPKLSGPFSGAFLPDAVMAATNPDAYALRQELERSITNTMRAILGAQFTEREGKDLLRRTIDARLPGKTSAQKLEMLQAQMQRDLDQKDRTFSYFGEKGTMTGFKYSPPSRAVYDTAAFLREAPKPKAAAVNTSAPAPARSAAAPAKSTAVDPKKTAWMASNRRANPKATTAQLEALYANRPTQK